MSGPAAAVSAAQLPGLFGNEIGLSEWVEVSQSMIDRFADATPTPRYLLRLVELELIDRERRVVERRIKQARFPATKSLDTFDFTAIPSLNKMLVDTSNYRSIST